MERKEGESGMVAGAEDSSPRFGLTIEGALWILVGVVALVLRLANLDAAPLDSREAREAMLAWQAVAGEGMPAVGAYSPLLFAGNVVLLFFFGASDVVVRLWPALFGTVLVLTPALFPRRLGRVGGLIAATYLAISPTTLLLSRQLDGTIIGATGCLVFLGGLNRFWRTERKGWLWLACAGLGLGLAASSSVYGLLLALGLTWICLAWAWPSSGGSKLIKLLRANAPRLLGVIGIVVLAAATGLGWNPAGLGAAGDLLVDWFSRFSATSLPVASPFVLMAVYEPLLVVAGLGGLVWAIVRGHRLGVALGLWGGWGLLLLALMPGRVPGDVVWVVLPLALFLGVVAQQVIDRLQQQRWSFNDGLYLIAQASLWVYFYIRLAQYARTNDYREFYLALLSLILPVLVASVIFLFSLVMWLAGQVQPAEFEETSAAIVGEFQRALAVNWLVVVPLVLLVSTVATGSGLAHERPADPREMLIHEPTVSGVRDLVETLEDLSWRETGAATTLPFTLEARPESVLAWYLRDFDAAVRVDSLDTLAADQLGTYVVTTRWDWVRDAPPHYRGQDFALAQYWEGSGLLACDSQWPPCRTGVTWLLNRQAATPPLLLRMAVLWKMEAPE